MWIAARSFLRGVAVIVAGTLLFQGPAQTQQAEPQMFRIGYIQIPDDIRYAREFVYARIPAVPRNRPLLGAQLALNEANENGRFLGIQYEMLIHDGTDVDEIAAWIRQVRDEQGVHFFVLDLGTEDIKALTQATRGEDVVLINATDSADTLRGEFCAPHLLHTAPSYAMILDALTQYLVFQSWVRILVLQGPMPDDAKLVAALQRSARRNGLNIIDVRPFVSSNDPRERELNNVRLMTAGTRDYDVVFIADTDGEFGRYVPYQTVRARPVVGTTGLVAASWHWTFERHGAPQINSRFYRLAEASGNPRFMYGPDWAAWAAVRSAATATARTRSVDYQINIDYMRSDQLRFDGYTGFQLDFRTWDNQLRENILISTSDAVIARAPLDKFEHAINDLDTLGVDRSETACRF